MSTLAFHERVAIVTGAGNGLGRAHALALAARGARVLVNDLAAGPAQSLVDEISAAGGQAMAVAASVADPAAVADLVAQVMARWGRVDILVNNAGILRDKSFAKMSLDDFRLVLDVHLMGAVHCTQAVWPHMVARKYGRVVMTTSSSGLFGNFGQANYGAAKMALVGLMQTLSIEGARHDIRVNCLAPTAATQMTEGLLPPDMLALLDPVAVVPALLWLVSEQAPSRAIACAGAGTFEAAHITLTNGLHLGAAPDTPEQLAAAWARVADRQGDQVPASGAAQGSNEIQRALAARR